MFRLVARNPTARSETALIFLRPNGVQPHSIEALHGLKASAGGIFEEVIIEPGMRVTNAAV